MKTSETTGALLRRYRERDRMSLRSVADQVGVSVPYLSHVERGNRWLSWRRLREFRRVFPSVLDHEFEALVVALSRERGAVILEVEGMEGTAREKLAAELCMYWGDLTEADASSLLRAFLETEQGP